MSALTDWLLEQIAADERDARKRIQFGEDWSNGGSFKVPTPRQEMVRCQVLRDLIERHDEAWEQRRPNGTPTRWGEHVWGGLVDALRIMARIYADRPGYAEAIE